MNPELTALISFLLTRFAEEAESVITLRARDGWDNPSDRADLEKEIREFAASFATHDVDLSSALIQILD